MHLVTSISRRSLLRGTTLLAVLASSLSRFERGLAYANVSGVMVSEVTMILPDLLRVEVHDGPITKHGITPATTIPEPRDALASWHSQDGSYMKIVGPKKDHWWFQVTRDGNYVNRAVSGTAGSYGTIGGRTVTAVGRKIFPKASGECRGDSGTNTTKACQMRHYLYLQLDGNLAPGDHTISFPPNMSINGTSGATSNLADYNFSFADKTTRCAAIKVNQYGYAPTDKSKQAYLSEWAPELGIEGRINFSSITDWHIMDRHGVIVWSAGAAPTLRVSATTTEPYGGANATHDLRLISTTQSVRILTGYTDTNPCRISYTGDNLVVDDRIMFMDVRSSMTIDGVPNTDSGTSLNVGNQRIWPGGDYAFEFVLKNVDNSNPADKKADLWFYPGPTYISGTLTPLDFSAGANTYRSGGKIYKVVTGVNRDATNVYDLNFTSFEPAEEGTYYIYIPGLGRSYPFNIDHANWHNIAGNMAAGEYHHRHQIDLDGRFGYTRPGGFSSANNTVYECLLPYNFSSEIGAINGDASAIAIAGLTTSPCYTGIVYNKPIMGHHDAGDHDSRIGSHEICYYGYMAFYDQFPEAASKTDWNIPKMLELFPDDKIYAGTNILPDCLQQAMYALHGYIVSINAAGFPRGGVNNTADSSFSPSYLKKSGTGGVDATTNTIFVYGPCEAAARAICRLAAKMAIVLRKWDRLHSTTSFFSLAQYYEDKAKACWDAAEAAWNNGNVPNATTDALYGNYEAACTALGLGAGFSSRLQAINSGYIANNHRFSMAALMYRLTGDLAYGDIAAAATGTSYEGIRYVMGLYEYAVADHANADTAKQALYRASIYSNADFWVVDFNTSVTGYKTLKQKSWGNTWGLDGTEWSSLIAVIASAYAMKERESPGSGEAYRKCLEDGFHYLLGANALGRSLITGLGTDVYSNGLHTDSMAMGVDMPKGITAYGPGYRYAVSAFIGGSHSPLHWTTENSNSSYTTDHEHYRKFYPPRHAFPNHEDFVEVPGAIEHSEYVFGGNIGPQQWAASLLWAGNGKLSTKLSSPV